MSHDPDDLPVNPSTAPTLSAMVGRRDALKGGLAVLATAFIARRAGAQADGGRRWFTPIASSFEDAVRVPPGYTARPVACWGDPVGIEGALPPFKPDASNPAKEQLAQFGMNFDGMAYFPLPKGSDSSTHGLLCINHEYTDRGLLHPAKPGFAFAPEQVEKEMYAHGVSVCEVVLANGEWRVRRPSKYARKITADSPIRVGGSAKGHALLRTAADPKGELVRGTLNNCANGRTPWGTYLTCEENVNLYFVHRGPVPAAQRRYGIFTRSAYGWAKAGPDGGARFERFDAGAHPNEPHRFGWVVEIDPYDPRALPVKRTALGRFKHENAAVTTAGDGRVVVYMGDDQPDEYVYKFVSSKPAGPEALDDGTLYVGRFAEDGTGEWVPLRPGTPGLEDFKDLGEILVHARLAGDAVGATPMDRPEWLAVDPKSGAVYCTLSNNIRRTEVNGPNPRPKNEHGQVVRWTEEDAGATAFRWDVFLLAGDPESEVESNRGNLRGDVFSSPDGLSFAADGTLWIQTDVSSGKMYHPVHGPGRFEYEGFGNNQMLAVDPAEGRVRRFLTGPVGCEVTGFTMTPDGRTLFVNIQHPGEPLDELVYTNDPLDPSRYSTWPYGGRPRSGTVAIRRHDDGRVGT